jgi:exosortase/archaeosortase
MSFSEKWDEPKDGNLVTIRVKRPRLVMILGGWLVAGILLGYTITDYIHAQNMICG